MGRNNIHKKILVHLHTVTKKQKAEHLNFEIEKQK